jgi:hypothetical protein
MPGAITEGVVGCSFQCIKKVLTMLKIVVCALIVWDLLVNQAH